LEGEASIGGAKDSPLKATLHSAKDVSDDLSAFTEILVGLPELNQEDAFGWRIIVKAPESSSNCTLKFERRYEA